MQTENSYGNGLFSILKGVGAAMLVSLILSVIFACVLRFAPIPDKAIYPVTQTIKAISIVLGALAFTRGEKGWLKGGAIALLFTALSYLTFSAIGGNFSLSWLLLAELAFSLLAGILGGIIAVNIRRF